MSRATPGLWWEEMDEALRQITSGGERLSQRLQAGSYRIDWYGPDQTEEQPWQGGSAG